MLLVLVSTTSRKNQVNTTLIQARPAHQRLGEDNGVKFYPQEIGIIMNHYKVTKMSLIFALIKRSQKNISHF